MDCSRNDFGKIVLNRITFLRTLFPFSSLVFDWTEKRQADVNANQTVTIYKTNPSRKPENEYEFEEDLDEQKFDQEMT